MFVGFTRAIFSVWRQVFETCYEGKATLVLQYVIHVLIFYPFVCTIQSVLMFWPLFSLLFFRVLEQMRRHWLTFFVPVLTRFIVTCIIKCTGLSLKLKEAGLLRKVATIKVWMWSKNNMSCKCFAVTFKRP